MASIKEIEFKRKEKLFTLLTKYIPSGLHSSLYNHIQEENYDRISSLLNNSNRMLTFTDIFDLIPNGKKYNAFLEFYSSNDNGYVKPSIIRKISELRPLTLSNKLKNKADNEGNLIIYRGEILNNEWMGWMKSTPIEKSISWTLNKKVAIFFANRFNRNPYGYLYTAKTNINDVMAYLTEREEDEILVRYRNLEILDKKTIFNKGE